jgi:hypothetical protein
LIEVSLLKAYMHCRRRIGSSCRYSPPLASQYGSIGFLERFFDERICLNVGRRIPIPLPARSTSTGAAGNCRPLRLLQRRSRFSDPPRDQAQLARRFR